VKTHIPTLALTLVVPALLAAQAPDSARRAAECPPCAEWNAPQRPFRVHGNTWYVGTRGLSALLVTSDAGHVLLDGGLPESAAPIMASIRALGFRVEDVKLVVNSHAHFDHAGGIAALQRASGAEVAALPWSAGTLRAGRSPRDDPQFGILLDFPAVARVRAIAPGDTLRVGTIAMVAHATGGHTPGGTSWSWRSCEGDRCVDVVYADSQSPISADGFLYTRSADYRTGIADFERGFATLERLRCDLIVTPHPGASRLFERVAARDAGKADALVDPDGCRRYAAAARTRLAERVQREKSAGH
jgi:metallo-beta-lactamase class B